MIQIQAAPVAAGSAAPATLVRAKMDGTKTDVWLTMQKFDNSQTRKDTDVMWLAILADAATKAFEASAGGSGQGFGVDCGVRVKSDGSKVWLVVQSQGILFVARKYASHDSAKVQLSGRLSVITVSSAEPSFAESALSSGAMEKLALATNVKIRAEKSEMI